MTCEWHKDCKEPVIAKIGLPYSTALWVCQQGFDEWQAKND